jgi:hypothetical protein
MAVVTWLGHWQCDCGKVHKLWDSCKCGQAPPCRWVGQRKASGAAWLRLCAMLCNAMPAAIRAAIGKLPQHTHAVVPAGVLPAAHLCLCVVPVLTASCCFVCLQGVGARAV